MTLITCQECGKEVSDKATSCPNCGAPIKIQNNQIQNNNISTIQNEIVEKKNESVLGIVGLCISFIMCIPIFPVAGLIICIIAVTDKTKKTTCAKVGIVLSLLFLVLGASIWGNDSSESETNNTIETKSNTEEISAKEKEEIKPSVENNINKESKEFYYVGDTFENKYIKITYTNSYEYTDYNQFNSPKDGYKIICAEFEVENIGKTDQTVMYTDFNGYADGYEVSQSYAPEGTGMDFSISLSAGRKGNGVVAFEVPENSEKIEIEFSPNFWSSEKVIFIY